VLKRFIFFIFILINLLEGNIHRYDDTEYLEEINQGDYHQGDIEQQPLIDDEYRGSSIRYNSSTPNPAKKLPNINNEKRYIMKDGVLKFSDENQLRVINKEEFSQNNELRRNLSIPYGIPIKIEIDIASQRMNIYANGRRYYQWKVSTGTWKYPTPRGYYRPYYLKKMHYSKKYDNAPMPHSVFFRGGFAIHGTYSTSRLGRRASHGCVRLHPSNAKKLFYMIKDRGKRNVSIVVK
jgi:lipoprotein-anchoring transpeptidase ErfK/SrfK